MYVDRPLDENKTQYTTEFYTQLSIRSWDDEKQTEFVNQIAQSLNIDHDIIIVESVTYTYEDGTSSEAFRFTLTPNREVVGLNIKTKIQ